jgi:carbon-monoxide dehydrogenase small subunit
MKHSVKLKVNGQAYELAVEPYLTLAELLRDELQLTGTKLGCMLNSCGCCGVLLDGKPVNSCSVLALQADGHDVLTVEGLAADGTLHPLQQAFVEQSAFQCGFCTPAILLTAKALLDENPSPTESDVRNAIRGTSCRCTGYTKYVQAILTASKESRHHGRAAR